MKRKSDKLLSEVRVMIAKLNDIVKKVEAGEMPKAFGKEQAHAFVKDITAASVKLREKLQRGEISRVDALLVAAQGRAAIDAIEKTKFGME